MKRKVPDTSHDAWRSVKDSSQIKEHHAKILLALEKGAASAEQIAARLDLDHWQVNRRMSELARKELIYNTRLRVPTSTGRTAFVWDLIKPGEQPIQVTEKIMEGKTVSDFSKEIIKKPVQQSIF